MPYSNNNSDIPEQQQRRLSPKPRPLTLSVAAEAECEGEHRVADPQKGGSLGSAGTYNWVIDKWVEKCAKKRPTPSTDHVGSSSSNQSDENIKLEDLPADPALRPPILHYKPNERDNEFPQKTFTNLLRRFNSDWFDEFPWLEYSISKDAAYCQCCYLFKRIGEPAITDIFVVGGYSNWKKKDRFYVHIGGPKSSHNNAFGQPFRGNDETKDSMHQGNFLETLQFLTIHNEDIEAVTLKNVLENLKLTSPLIQKDIVNAIALETINVILRDMGNAFFSILIDESKDISSKEQMACVLRYVDKNGQVIERFVGLVHVTDTSAISLKMTIDELFSRHGLSISRLRGQGYDGASNMRGAFNGLKTLILRENESAFYIHCFAYQLQLALVGMTKKHEAIVSLFAFVANLLNVVGGSSKRRDILQENQISVVKEALDNGELLSGQGLNQNTSLKRTSDTRWGSHYDTLISVITMFSSTITTLETILNDGTSEQKFEVNLLLKAMESFDFVFSLHLMVNILGITNELLKALQNKDQDIVIAMTLVKLCKHQLQKMRDGGWDCLLDEVSSFCAKHDILVPNMDDPFQVRGRSRRNVHEKSNLHHYRVELFYTVIDMQLQELNDRFNEVNTELLLCVACLCPDDAFCAFEKQKLIQLAKFYPKEFSSLALIRLGVELENYIADVRSSSEFEGLKGIADLAKRMVKTKRNNVHSLVYLLVTLALTLPVATAIVERAFSAMKIIKTRMRNKMGDAWMSDSLVTYIEKYISVGLDNEVIIRRFQDMKNRRGQL